MQPEPWTRETLAWMGGLYEGEGSVSIPKKNSPFRLRIKSTDRDVLIRFQKYAKCGGTSGPFKASGLGKKDVWEFAVTGRRAFALAVALWSFLGARRRFQLKAALTAYAVMSPDRSLSRVQVREIKVALRAGRWGSGRALAKKFNVSEGLISAIKAGRIWRNV
mgnify:CR=1